MSVIQVSNYVYFMFIAEESRTTESICTDTFQLAENAVYAGYEGTGSKVVTGNVRPHNQTKENYCR